MNREEFEALLEEAFEAGYEDAVEEIFDESDEEYVSEYEDLFDESSTEYEYSLDDLVAYDEARDDTKFDRFRKALVKGVEAPTKELGVSGKTRKEIGKTFLAATGKMNPKLKAKAFAKHLGSAAAGVARDRDKVLKNARGMSLDLANRSAEADKPMRKEIIGNDKLRLKGEIAGRILKGAKDKFIKGMAKVTGNPKDKDAGHSYSEYKDAFKRFNKRFGKEGRSIRY